MISNTLPKFLRAISAGRAKVGVDGGDSSQYTEEVIDHKGTSDVTVITPETFHMTLGAPVQFEVVVRVLKRLCYRHKAKLQLVHIRKADINTPPRARVKIKAPYKDPFDAVLMVEGDFVSFISLV